MADGGAVTGIDATTDGGALAGIDASMDGGGAVVGIDGTAVDGAGEAEPAGAAAGSA
jgi:hypothetical protein